MTAIPPPARSRRHRPWPGLAALLLSLAAAGPAAGADGGDWARVVGTRNREYGTAIAVDAAGATYVTGFFLGELAGAAGEPPLVTAGDSDVLVLKLDRAGRTVWARRFGSEGGDEGRGITVGPSGDVYITGFFSQTVDFDPGPPTSALTSAGSADIFVVRLRPDGSLVWARRFGGPYGDSGHDLAVGADGRVHLAGYFQGEIELRDGEAALKLASLGALDALWLRLDDTGDVKAAGRFGGKGADEARGIAATDDGGAVLCGLFRHTATGAAGPAWTSRGGTDAFLLKIGGAPAAGDPLGHLGGPIDDSCNEVAVEPSGGVLAIGRFTDSLAAAGPPAPPLLESAGGADAYVLALEPGGAVRWARSLGAAGSDFGFDVATAGAALWATGFEQPVPGQTGGGESRSFVTRLAAATGATETTHLLTAEAGIQLFGLAAGPAAEPHVVGVSSGGIGVSLDGRPRRLPGAGKVDLFVARLAAGERPAPATPSAADRP